MERGDFEIQIASPPDREKLVAMILVNKEQWAELNRESGEFTLELYPRQDGHPWVFDYNKALRALQIARERLAERTK